MNTEISTAFRRLRWSTLFVALLSSAAHVQAQGRPADPPWLTPPEISAHDQSTDNRIWRYVPLGPRGRYVPVEGSEMRPSAPQREVARWVGPRGTVPVYHDEVVDEGQSHYSVR